MGRIFAKIRNFFGVLTMVVIASGVIGLIVTSAMRPGVPTKTVLEVDLGGEFVDYKPASPVAQALLDGSKSFLTTLDAIEKATNDDRVVGLVARLDNVAMGFGNGPRTA